MSGQSFSALLEQSGRLSLPTAEKGKPEEAKDRQKHQCLPRLTPTLLQVHSQTARRVGPYSYTVDTQGGLGSLCLQPLTG